MSVTFTGFTDRKTLPKYRAAFNNAKFYLAQARRKAKYIWADRKKVSKAHKRGRDHFELFFGQLTEARAKTVYDNLTLVMKAMISDLEIIYDATDPDALAYVYVAHCADAPGDAFTSEIRFCPPLISDHAALGTNSAMGTIVHELTHLVLGTEDHVYGLKSCTELIPAEKITNADNYQFYVEFFQYKSGTFPDLEDDTNLHQPPRRT